jgi:putative peptide zinc metalloprotease protein
MTIAEERAGTTTDGAEPPPSLADGVELIGEYEGSGFKEAPSLIRRSDGQVIQLPPLLYSVAAHADGARSYDDIAEVVSQEIQRGLDGEQVRFLADEKLRPLGVLTLPDGTSPQVAKPDPFLGLKLRMGVISERTSNALGVAFKPLFLAPIVLAVLAAFVAMDVWLFFDHGVAQALRQSIQHPGLFLALFGAVVLSAGFHEIGHAAACRYGGGSPGKMGCGLYLAWPAFYTDVTDAYRLGKWARLRTDLGGVYFNVVIILATIGAYFVTGFEPLLLLALIQHFEIAHQLLPVVRLDGYYIVADMTGVPDLFARIGPILRSMVPWRRADDQVRVLKPWVRFAVTAWVLVVVPLLLFELLMVLIHLPRIIGTAWASGVDLWHAAGSGFGSGDLLGGVSSAIQIVVLAIPIVGIGLMLWKAGTGLSGAVWRRTAGKPLARGVALLLAAFAITALALAWIPKDNYRSIQPGERGTLSEGLAAVATLPSGHAPLVSEQRAEERGDIATTTVPDAVTTTTTSSTTSTSVPEDSTSTTVEKPNTATTARPHRSTTTTSTTEPSTTTTTTEAPSTTTTTAGG